MYKRAAREAIIIIKKKVVWQISRESRVAPRVNCRDFACMCVCVSHKRQRVDWGATTAPSQKPLVQQNRFQHKVLEKKDLFQSHRNIAEIFIIYKREFSPQLLLCVYSIEALCHYSFDSLWTPSATCSIRDVYIMLGFAGALRKLIIAAKLKLLSRGG